MNFKTDTQHHKVSEYENYEILIKSNFTYKKVIKSQI